MQVPRLYTGIALIFWGWQTQTVWFAVILALIIELPWITRTKFELGIADFNKFVDISIMILAATLIFALTMDTYRAARILLKWLPFIFFPIMAAQQYSTFKRIDLRSFFFASRKKRIQQLHEAKSIDISYLYNVMILFAAASANMNDLSYFAGVSFFGLWALWQHRSKRFPAAVWCCIMILSLGSGFFFQKNIKSFGIQVTHWLMDRYADYYSANPFKSFTAIGDIGQIKLSDKIKLRILPEKKGPIEPILLHQATYNKFIHTTWFSKSNFTVLSPQPDQTTWRLNTLPEDSLSQKTSQMVMYSRPIRDKAILSLPAGVTQISELDAGLVKKNKYDAVQIEDVDPIIRNNITYTNTLLFDAEPDAADLFISKKDRPMIQNFVQSSGLPPKGDLHTLSRLKDIFSNQFQYTLRLKGKGRHQSALENFLFHTRSGHCELFATAAVLILRQTQIPARYATGYIAHEYAPLSGHILVRQKDAHAWVKAYVNGQWINFDPTPASFLQFDNNTVDTFWLKDGISFLGFTFSRLRHETGKQIVEDYGLWLILPLGLILFFRLRKKSNIKKVTLKEPVLTDTGAHKKENLFLKLENQMAEIGLSRFSHEPLYAWFFRIKTRMKTRQQKHFQDVIRYQYLARFGGSDNDRKTIAKLSKSIIRLIKELQPR